MPRYVKVVVIRGGYFFNLCFSNQNVDFVRMNAAVFSFPGFHAAGGKLALGGSYFHFIKEIPMLAEYEIRLYFGGWETSKWFYLYTQYLTYPKKKKDSNSTKAKAIDSASGQAEQAAKDLLRGVHQTSSSTSDVGESVVIVRPETTTTTADSSAIPSGLVSPAPGLSSGGTSTPNPSRINIETPPVPEGATLHATAVSQYCCKFGRITVPPRVAFIVSGFGDPNRWERLQRIRKGKEGKGKMEELLKGGWKNESEGDFWDFKECEPEGLRRGAQIRHLKDVMEALEAD